MHYGTIGRANGLKTLVERHQLTATAAATVADKIINTQEETGNIDFTSSRASSIRRQNGQKHITHKNTRNNNDGH